VRFADVLSIREDGTRVVDYHHFHEVVPLEQAAGEEEEAA
jgi:hypothetical protein